VNLLFILIPLVLVLTTVTYGVIRALGRIWLDHQMKLALLERLQEKPELIESFQELQTILDRAPGTAGAGNHQDYRLTGIILAAIGVGCAAVGRGLGVGRFAVGAYVGGCICVVLGFVLLLAGLLIRWLSRHPVLYGKK
jgi:hypothetical protein